MSSSSETIRSQRIVAAFVAHSLGNAVTVAEHFLLVPIMLMFWGPETFGVWTIIRSIPAYLAFSQMGFASAAGNMLTRFVIAENYASARNVYWSTNTFITGISLICLSLTTLVVLAAPLTEVFNCEIVSPGIFGGSVVLMALYTVATFRTGLLYALARSVERHAIVTFQIHVTRILEILGCISALALGGGVFEVSLAYVAIQLAGIFAIEHALRRHIIWLGPRTKCDRRLLREMIKPATGFAVLPIAQAFQLQGVTLVLALTLSPSMVAAYTSMRTLARLPTMIGSSLCRTAWPEMSSAMARNDVSLLMQIYRKTYYLSAGTNILSVIILAILGHTIFDFWTSARLPFEQATFLLLCTGAAATSFTTATMAILNAGGTHGRSAMFWTTASMVSLIVCFAFRHSLSTFSASIIMLVFDSLIFSFILLATRGYLREIENIPVADPAAA